MCNKAWGGGGVGLGEGLVYYNINDITNMAVTVELSFTSVSTSIVALLYHIFTYFVTTCCYFMSQ